MGKTVAPLVYVADPFHRGMRLDRFLVLVMHAVSRSRAQKIIKEGRVLVDGIVRAANHALQPGNKVTVLVEDRRLVKIDTRALPILYQDEYLLAIDKPASMLVHPVGRSVGGTVVEKVRAMLNTADLGEVSLCNRLDKETSGVVLLALHKTIRIKMQKAFETRQVKKSYFAVVHGHPEPVAGRVDLPIGRHPTAPVRIKQAVHGLDARPCLTFYRVLKTRGDYALVELVPHSGRQHQLRVHMAHLGHPLVGDRLYGGEKEPTRWPPPDFPEDAPIQRQALHAWRLEFLHPVTGQGVRLEAPLPEDMGKLLAINMTEISSS